MNLLSAASLLLLLSAAPAHAQEAPVAIADLEELLSPVTSDRSWRDATHAVQIVNVRTGEEVFARNADRGLIPASTMKAMTTAAALKNLGPSYKFTTGIYRDGRVDNTGTLHGNLYVQGHGDPMFVVEKLWKLVYDLKLDGIDKVTGDVIFDESFFKDQYSLRGWDKPEDIERGPSYYSRQSALSLNFNTVALIVSAGEEVGGEANVQLETAADPYVEIVNEVTTGASRSYRRIAVERTFDDDHTKFVVRGSMPSGGATARYYRTVEDPTAHFMAAFMNMMEDQDIDVAGRGKRGVTPDSATLLKELRSPPLASILMDMNKYSNNFMAEQVLRTLGAEVKGVPGSTAKGLEVVEEYIDSVGMGDSGHKLHNGSGLSRKTRVAPSVMTAMLVDMARDQEVGHEFRTSLSIGGSDGTLRRRLRDEPGRLRGKTGTIDGVHCLAGYVLAADGELYAFAFMANDIRGGISRVKKLHDSFARRIFELHASPEAVVEGATDTGPDTATESP